MSQKGRAVVLSTRVWSLFRVVVGSRGRYCRAMVECGFPFANKLSLRLAFRCEQRNDSNTYDRRRERTRTGYPDYISLYQRGLVTVQAETLSPGVGHEGWLIRNDPVQRHWLYYCTPVTFLPPETSERP